MQLSEWKDLSNDLDVNTQNIITLRQSLENFINESSVKKKKVQSLRTQSDKLQSIRNDLNKKLYETQSHKNNFSNQNTSRNPSHLLCGDGYSPWLAFPSFLSL